MNAQDFQKFMGDVYAKGCLMMSTAMGHELGLFKYLCKAEKPVSANDVAEALNLKERYTREWLSGMMTAGIIEQDKETRLYTVPESHKPALLKSTPFAPAIVCMGLREKRLNECFRKDGPWGISFQENPEFFDWFNEFRRETCDQVVSGEIIPIWNKQPGLIESLEKGISVLDLACGSGNLTNALAQKFPNSTFIGLDYSEKGIELANEDKAAKGVTNVTYVVGDAHHLPADWTGKFDLIFLSDALHDMPNPDRCLEELYRVASENGCMSVSEPGFHSDPLQNAGNINAAMFHTMGTFFCLTSSLCEPPHVGYGAMWGMEEVEKAVHKQKFKTAPQDGRVISGNKVYFHFIK